MNHWNRIMGIKLHGIRIYNYRSIKEVELKLENFTVLFGMNDSGKSNFIRAIKLAIGNGSVDETDVFVSPDEPNAKEKSVIVDLMFIPTDEKGLRVDSFELSWKEHLGAHRMIDNDGEFFSFRTAFFYDENTGTFVRNRKIIKTWNPESIGSKLGYQTIAKFDFVLIDAGRDISVEIRDKYSVWGREMSNLRINSEQKIIIEKQLDLINRDIIDNSSLLRRTSKHLQKYAIGSRCEVELSPIAKTIDDLHQGMEINIVQDNKSSIPIANMGLGTRNKASIAAIMAIICERM